MEFTCPLIERVLSNHTPIFLAGSAAMINSLSAKIKLCGGRLLLRAYACWLTSIWLTATMHACTFYWECSRSPRRDGRKDCISGCRRLRNDSTYHFYNNMRTGPRMDPWGMPYGRKSQQVEDSFSTPANLLLSHRQDSANFGIYITACRRLTCFCGECA